MDCNQDKSGDHMPMPSHLSDLRLLQEKVTAISEGSTGRRDPVKEEVAPVRREPPCGIGIGKVEREVSEAAATQAMPPEGWRRNTGDRTWRGRQNCTSGPRFASMRL